MDAIAATSAASAPPARSSAQGRKAIIGGTIGNVVEWFDFGVYAYLAPILAALFFDPNDPTTGLLATFSIFAVAFFTRPLGGAVFGHFGDKLGRRPALAAAVLLMTLATVGIGLLPTYAAMGLAAPLLLLFLRMVQGFAAGGEYVGAASFVVEYAPSHRRGLYASFVAVGILLGLLLAVLVVAGLTAALGTEAMSAWGWRVPFLLAAPMGLVGVYLRNRLQDTPEFADVEQRKEVAAAPLREALRSQWARMLVLFGILVSSVGALGILLTYLATYLQRVAQLPPGQALLSNSIAVAVLALLCPVAGMLSDRIGRKPMLLAGSVSCTVLGVPAFLLLSSGTFLSAVLGQLLLVVPLFFLGSIIIAVLVEMFPPRLRYSSASISYNLAQAVFGGTAALVSVELISRTGSVVAPGWYLAALGLVSTVIVVTAYRETAPHTGGHA